MGCELSFFLKQFFDSGKPIFVTEFGHSKYEQSRKVGPWSREMYILHFVTRGYSDFSGFTAREGEAFLISKERLHSFTTSTDYEHYWIGFEGDAVDAVFSSFGLEYTSHRLFFVENSGFAKTLLSSTAEMLECGTAENEESLVLSTLMSLLSLLKTEKQTLSPTKINYAEKAAALIKNNYMYPLTMSRVAGEIHLSEKYMYRLFVERFGISPQQFLIKTRMEKARELLSQNNLSVSETASSVGYASISVFSKTFLKFFGVNPSSFKK